MLERFRKAKLAEIEALKKCGVPAPSRKARPDFVLPLRRAGQIAVIAEYKRASPSRGMIRSDLPVEEAARQYMACGAAAMSILTEETWFRGNLDFLEVACQATDGALPLLRKDFIFDPVQIAATAATPASALLLIARMLPGAASLRDLRERAEAYGIAAVVEVFNREDLAVAREAGAKIIQVNARDLDTLKVSRSACLELIAEGRPEAGETWIAASGMSEPEHLAAARSAGFHAALVGSSLMEQESPGEALEKLLKGGSHET